MPGLLTGSSARRGFTLVEVLLATTILAVGALLALPSLQRSADYLNYLYQRRDAEVAINNLLVRAELKFKQDGNLRGFPAEGETSAGGTTFQYEVRSYPVNTGEALMELQVAVRWLREGTSGLTRSAYVAN